MTSIILQTGLPPWWPVYALVILVAFLIVVMLGILQGLQHKTKAPVDPLDAYREFYYRFVMQIGFDQVPVWDQFCRSKVPDIPDADEWAKHIRKTIHADIVEEILRAYATAVAHCSGALILARESDDDSLVQHAKTASEKAYAEFLHMWNLAIHIPFYVFPTWKQYLGGADPDGEKFLTESGVTIDLTLSSKERRHKKNHPLWDPEKYKCPDPA